MKIIMTEYLNCSYNFAFAQGATIRTKSGRSLGATCDPKEAENIIKAYFETEFFPETVYVYFGGEIGQDGSLGYTFSVAK
jgi:hypothetical protein